MRFHSSDAMLSFFLMQLPSKKSQSISGKQNCELFAFRMLARRTQHHHPSPPSPSSPAATDGAPLTQDSVAAANCSPLGAVIPPALDWWFGGSAGATTSWSPERRASHQSSFDILPTFWPPSFWKSASTRGLTRAFCYLLLIFWIHFTFFATRPQWPVPIGSFSPVHFGFLTGGCYFGRLFAFPLFSPAFEPRSSDGFGRTGPVL